MPNLPTGFRWNPAYYLMTQNAMVALAAAFVPGLNLTDTRTAAISTIATGVLGAVTVVFFARPVDIAAAVAGLGTAVQAAAVFGLHLTANQTATATAVLSLILGSAFHQKVTPVAAVRQGTTVDELNRKVLANR